LVTRFFRRPAPLLTLLVCGFAAVTASSQVPIPLREQVDSFNSLPTAQQQALMRELQQQLPPAQREAILSMLQGQPGARLPAGGALPAEPSAVSQAGPFPPVIVEPRFNAGDTLVISFETRETVAADVATTAMLQRLADSNPYVLDSSGVLHLPGVQSIPLAGLNVEEASVRMGAEPALRPFDMVITRMPLARVGVEALEPFGYDLFRGVPSTFAPATDIPVPTDYVIGPGDTVNVQLFGNQNAEYFLTVSREGVINFPEIGPLNVSGLSFSDLRNTINERVAEQMIGVRASTTLGELRSIRVFVLGDVVRPGSYTVSGLSTMTNALFVSGGVRTIGSLRNIALMRNGETATRLDLYDLLLRGDTSGDARLQPGDVIFVPPIGSLVTIDGEVRRPAIYELNGEQSVSDIVALAGGLNANADRSALKLERIVSGRGTSVREIDLESATLAESAVRDGDVLRVQPNLSQLEDTVRLEGNVYQPGLYEWFPGMRISELLPSPELIKPLSDLNYVLIRREVEPNVDIDVLSADLEAAWDAPGGVDDLELQPRDTVYLFNFESGRQYIIEPMIDELQAQASPTEPVPVVRIGGRVRAQGQYPLEPDMRISDLLRAGGGLSESAYGIEAELTRYSVVDGQYLETELVSVDLAALRNGRDNADILLAPSDYLNVKELPSWRDQQNVTILGEVVFPGTYPIRQGETLSSVLERAGGLTNFAFPQGSVFTRVELREREREQIDNMVARIQADLASISLSGTSAVTASDGQVLLRQLRESVPTGRLVIALQDVLRGVSGADVVLKDGDQLIVPDEQQEVSVLGEVQYATSHFFEPGVARDEYINRSGGLTERGDRKRIYVVHANGQVVVSASGRWFNRGGGAIILPGDTIVVPLQVDRPLARWSAITQIVYNLAIAAAAVNSF